MAIQKIPLPFSLSNVYGGFGKVKGLLHLEKDRMRLDYQSEDNIVGLVKSKPMEIVIPFEDMESINLKTNLFSTRFIIRVIRLASIADFPKPTGNIPAGELRLSLKRADRERAKQVESYTNLRLSEIRLENLDKDELY
ncbi:MAG: hypothetical protein MRZ79_08210 [Bacteroidia bacterium]|nr:hypothetical protein [Bacteroidia bacterium]